MAPAVAEPATIPLLMLGLKDLKPSPLNPRTHFDQAKLEELAATMAGDVGVIEPLVARSVNGHYEIVAGERRWRAAKIANLAEVPVVVRPLTDAQTLEIMVIENGEREGLNALEEGEGFKRLLKFGFDVDKLADRIKKSRKYIYDRIKLVADLSTDAKQLLLDGRITDSHAILLSRLTPAQQKQALDPERGGLFDYEEAHSLFTPDEKEEQRKTKDPFARKRLTSVRELESWINEHARVDPNDPKQLEALFPESVQAVQAAATVVHITYDTWADASDKKGERIHASTDWKRADGAHKSKACDHAVLGVVVIGPGRGEAFNVCVDKACATHWPKPKPASSSSSGGTATKSAVDKRWEEQLRKNRERDRKEAAARKRWQDAGPAIIKAAAERLAAVSVAAIGELAASRFAAFELKDALKQLGKPKTAEDFLRVFALSAIVKAAGNSYAAPREMPKLAKAIGLNLKPLLQPKAEKKPAVTTFAQARPKKAKAGKKR